ncbi:hypothetical protein E1262_05825 [Jiangella aurantiaca]|uniref:Uncharacterized protein n=1 Tax=Jiangella aurantiaca TaxID=2530373 RepID=A0A4R5AN31_9ACTN|nr:hypothetical protein [Jiangella aurantiaca]TDD71652.1 hypothetical protein E1262_05825 [Jiangella aurantiaca]
MSAALAYRRSRASFLDLSAGFSTAVLWFFATVAVIFLLIGLGIELASGIDGGESIWENSQYATRYFPLSMGIMITAAYLPVAVASGVTRRSFAWAGTGAVLALSGLMALFEAGGYLIEYGLYRVIDVTPQFTTRHLFDQGYQFWIIVPEVWIVVAANVAAGWLIGSAYYKWGWFGPTLALPLLLLPLVAVEAIMAVGWAGEALDAMNVEHLPTAAAVPAALAVLALTLAGMQRFVRAIDLRPQKA